MIDGSTGSSSALQEAPARPVATARTGPAAAGWWGSAAPRELVGDALVAIAMLVLAGVLVGAGWALVAPTAEGLVVAAQVGLTEAQWAQFFAAEGLFAVIAFAAGALTAVLARDWLVRGGAVAVVTLAVGGVVASIVAARVGVWLGPDPVVAPVDLAAGSAVQLPLRLQTSAMLLLWPIATVFVALWLSVLAPDPHAPPVPPARE